MAVKFIAEVSSNHSQDLSRALAFVDAAADCGCAVKFQLFCIAELLGHGLLEACAAADPSDGLRPLRHVRATWVSAG